MKLLLRKKHSIFLFIICLFCVANLSAQSEPKIIDVVFVHGNPDYVNLAGKKTEPAKFSSFQSRNLQSFAIGYKAWGLMGELVYNPSFVYEIDSQKLIGKSRTVEFYKIQKYPDLAKRYKALRPTSVSFTITLELWYSEISALTKEKTGKRISKFVHFKVNDNDLAYSNSRSSYNQMSPTSPMKWKQAMSMDIKTSTRFTETDTSNDKDLQELLKNFEFVSSPQDNLQLDIKWDENAIDKIAEDYDRYEKEGKKIADEKKELNTTSTVKKVDNNSDMSLPVDESPKTAESFDDKDRVGLKANGKIVFESTIHWSADKLGSLGDLYSFKIKKAPRFSNYIEVINATGKKLSVNGYSRFYAVEKLANSDAYLVTVVTGEEVFTSNKIYYEVPYIFSATEFDSYKKYDQSPPPLSKSGSGNSVSIGFKHYHQVYSSATTFTVDSKFRLISSETSFCKTREINTQTGQTYIWAGEYKKKQ